MKTKKSIAENYSKELEGIIQQIKLIETGQSSDSGLINRVKNVIASAYYDGMNEGVNDMNKFIKANFILKNWKG